jgi:hypothetical protein
MLHISFTEFLPLLFYSCEMFLLFCCAAVTWGYLKNIWDKDADVPGLEDVTQKAQQMGE